MALHLAPGPCPHPVCSGSVQTQGCFSWILSPVRTWGSKSCFPFLKFPSLSHLPYPFTFALFPPLSPHLLFNLRELGHILSLTRSLVSLRTRELRLGTAERREDLVLKGTGSFLGILHELVTLQWDEIQDAERLPGRQSCWTHTL